MRIAFYGSSLLSSYWNGAATYYRGILPPWPRSAATSPSTSRTRSTGRATATSSRRTRHASVVYPATAGGLASVLAQAAKPTWW